MTIYLSSDDITTQAKWSRNTFGPGTREPGIIEHIKKELLEIEEAVTPEDKLSEWIDIIILGIDGAQRVITEEKGQILSHGHIDAMGDTSVGRIILGAYFRKMNENYNREWPDWRNFKQNQAIEHIRETDAS